MNSSMNSPERQAAVERSRTWLAAYRAEEAGHYAKAASLYDKVAEMHDAIGLIQNAALYRAMAQQCRDCADKATTAPK